MLCAALALIPASAWADDAPDRVRIGVAPVPDQARAAVSALARHDNVVLSTAQPDEVPGRDVILQQAVRLYAAMEFRRAHKTLLATESALISQERPSAARTARLADVELFLGACALLDRDAKGGEDRFALAKALVPGVGLDPLFPPEVTKAFAASRPGPPVVVRIVVSPADARLWIDGRTVEPQPSYTLSEGLHYLVVERIDRVPRATVVRVSRAAPTLELSANEPFLREQVYGRLAEATLIDDDGLRLARAAHRPLWSVRAAPGGLELRRFSVDDPAQPVRTRIIPSEDPGALARAVCEIDRCDAPVSGQGVPLRRRAWFWGVIGAGVAAVVGGVVVGAVLGTRPRDYEAVIR